MPNCAAMRSIAPRASSRSGLKKGDRLALVAETGPEFAICFFGAIYAGAVAGSAAAADLVRRARNLCRSIGRPAREQRPGPVPLSARARRLRRRSRAPPQRRIARLGQPRRNRGDPGRASRRRRRRYRLSAIFERIDPLPARRRGDPPRLARQSCAPTASGSRSCETDRVRLLAALVSRHGPGRLHALAGRQPDCRSII